MKQTVIKIGRNMGRCMKGALLCCMFLSLCLLCGCGGKKTDAGGNAVIQSEWEFAESTINGSTLNVEDDSAAMKEFTADVTPTFECSDDMHCVFTLNGKYHDGTVTEEGTGRYRIDFYDKYKSFLVEIVGERMTFRNEKGNVSLVFKIKQD